MPNLWFKLYGDSKQFEETLGRAQRAATITGGQIAKKFEFKDAGKSLATALGVSFDAIADKAARFFTGFSKEVEEAYATIIDATTKLADMAIDRMRSRLSDEQKLTLLKQDQLRLEKEIAAAGAREFVRQGRGKGGFLREITPEQQAKQATLSVEQEKNLKEQRELQLKIDDKAKQKADELTKSKAKLVSLEKEGKLASMSDVDQREEQLRIAKALRMEVAYVGGTEQEIADKLVAAQEAENRAAEIGRKIDEDKIKLAEKRAQIAQRIVDLQKEVGEDRSKLSDAKNDRGRLSLEELAKVGPFQFGADAGAIGEGSKARDIQDILRKAEEARGGGRIDEANSLFTRADSMREGLGSLKSDERDPFKAMKDALKDSEDKLQKIVDNSAKLPTNL